MTIRQESEGEGKVARSYSLASAPLRLLSHSFHSTANTHSPPYSGSSHGSCSNSSTSSNSNSSNSRTNDPTDFSTQCLDSEPYPQQLQQHQEQLPHSELSDVQSDTVATNRSAHDRSLTTTDSPAATAYPHNPYHQREHQHQHQYEHKHQHKHQQPIQSQEALLDHPRRKSRENKRQAQHISDTVDVSGSDQGQSVPFGRLNKTIILHNVPSPFSSPRITQLAISQLPLVQSPSPEAQRLERLLLPYDIRFSIFGRLSLLDIYNCQLTCKLLYWATSDQSIWKRIALQLIQGEFYFDIPRALPANIPNWKYFCKRHALRQQNWRLGQVQDVVTLDDNYKKLTTLQITAPYVLTGCDDGRVHLWNINTRKLLNRFQITGEITWVEHLQEQKIVAGLGYDIDKNKSEIRLFSTETGEQIGQYEEAFWGLAICAINAKYLVASDGEGLYTTWDWRSGAKVSQFKVEDEISITEALYLVQDTILELHYDGLIRLFSITGECFGRFTLDNILPNHKVSFCWLHNDFSMVVWESSNTMAHIRLPLLQGKTADGLSSASLQRPITQEEWDVQGAEIYWRHQLTHTCNFAAMGGGRFQMLYVQILENLQDQVPIRVHSLQPNRPSTTTTASAGSTSGTSTTIGITSTDSDLSQQESIDSSDGYGLQHGEYVTAHSLNPELEAIIQGLRPSRIDCDPEYIVVGLLQGGVRLLQFAPVVDELVDKEIE
ncbi:hypothetical protein BGZ94_002647 [Podila epigama]|nr:hypothetical protein BGZ94_002647 [Podila epigama]